MSSLFTLLILIAAILAAIHYDMVGKLIALIAILTLVVWIVFFAVSWNGRNKR